VSFSELENDTLNQAELNEIKINENNIKLCTGLDNISKYYSYSMKTLGSHPVSNFEA
jgi:hypothetical protein